MKAKKYKVKFFAENRVIFQTFFMHLQNLCARCIALIQRLSSTQFSVVLFSLNFPVLTYNVYQHITEHTPFTRKPSRSFQPRWSWQASGALSPNWSRFTISSFRTPCANSLSGTHGTSRVLKGWTVLTSTDLDSGTPYYCKLPPPRATPGLY